MVQAMSNHDNHRRGERKRTEHGPRWEHGGSDNTHVARSRRKWKRIRLRTLRRTGMSSPKVWGSVLVAPSTAAPGDDSVADREQDAGETEEV